MPLPLALLAAATFTLCSNAPRINCVVDGDTFWLRGEKVRMADINAPETHAAGCPAEAELGQRATFRLMTLLNAGPFELAVAGRATDRYGRALRVVTRGGRSLGAQLVSEGLAEPWRGRRSDWCVALAAGHLPR
jgi:micrococcal nuclease